jgi:ABC-type multidrug transport system ATPase subunit
LVVEWLDVVGSLKRGKLLDTDELGIRPLLGRRVSALSLGERQRVSLCAAFIGEPRLFVLDEPTNALDHGARVALIERLQDATILLATHDAELVRSLAARVVQMKDGQITSDEGPTAE